MRLTVIQWFPPSRFPTKRCLDAADVTVFVDEDADVDIAEAGEVVAERRSLSAAELEQKRPAAPHESGSVPQHASEDCGPVGSAVVGERRLERERVALQARQCGGRYVRHDADDDVDAPLERPWQWGEQVPQVDLHAVRLRAGDRPLVEVGGYDAGAGAVRHQGPGDCSGPGADIDRGPVCGQALDGARRERLTLAARNVDTRIDADLQGAERNPPGDPREWLARQTARDERLEDLAITGRASEKFVSLFFRRNEPGPRELRGKRRRVDAHELLPATASSTRQVLLAAVFQLNSALRACPAAISRCCNAASLASSSIAWLQAPASSGLNRMPAVPTISGSAPAVDAMTAVPHAIASTAGKPKPSKREGSVSAIAPA